MKLLRELAEIIERLEAEMDVHLVDGDLVDGRDAHALLNVFNC